LHQPQGRESLMNLKKLATFLAAVIMGCSTPVFNAPKGKECEFECQNVLKSCIARCYEAAYADSAVYVCVKQCNREFTDCDQLCQNKENGQTESSQNSKVLPYI
jgi:hypothetical protein